jgi:L-fucose dehydrogenase
MDLQLSGKVILVSGGATGIGAAIVRDCASEGAIALIVDQDVDAGTRLQADLHNAGLRCEFFPVELDRADACASAAEHIVNKFGRLDALVINTNSDRGRGSAGDEQFAQTIERILIACYAIAHYALPGLKKAQGSIVNVVARTTSPGQPGYTLGETTNEAVLALTREWAAELLGYGIRVNAVIAEAGLPQAKQRGSLPTTSPEKRKTGEENIAVTVALLLSEKSAHTTGQHLFVDAH